MTFSKELSVGNRIIDSEHKKLIDILNATTPAILRGEVDALLKGFELLENCLRSYFAVEENIAQAIGFDFAQHKISHHDLMYKFQKLKNELVTKCTLLSERERREHVNVFHRYLECHILLDSAPLERALSAEFYDLKA